jgi:hypothetical protein
MNNCRTSFFYTELSSTAQSKRCRASGGGENYTLETVVDGIPIPGEWPVAGRLHVSHREKRNFIPRKTAKKPK